MQIKRLRLTGFKSFVDPADLRIEPGLTGVVGPNGCGKSNLLEALRWTMGEGSPKSLRGAGMEDVIFAGTASRPPRDFAEVSILAEVEGDDREIVRRIERGAGSAYRIDGRDVRAKDVALLFADAATGAHSPALVSQNRIGAVIAAKPADRRAMLEEAAGISGLHVRRRDAEGKLRATEANLEQADALVAEQQARAATLRRQARQAERYRLLSGEIRVAEARMIFARWREAAAAADAAKAEITEAEAQVDAAAEAQRVGAAERETAATAAFEARTAAQAARDRASEAAHALATLRADKAAAERRLTELADAEARLAADRAREGALAEDAAAALARLAEEAKAIESRVAVASAALPARDAEVAAAERTARDAEVALAQGLARQAEEAAERRVAEAALSAARARLDRAERAFAEARATLAALPAPEPLASERDRAAQTAREAAAQADAARERIGKADAAERAATARRDAAQSARAIARAELAALESEAAALARATKRDGRDRLLDHVRAAPGYERALAAALGDDLDAPRAAWRGADPDEAPAPDALAPHVSAPPELVRRLAQVIVLDLDDARPLAAGQRLVTRAGTLRRWDGFVAEGSGAAAAERLERLNRLAAIETALPSARDAVAAADADLAAAERDIVAARDSARTARATLAAAETRARDATARADRAAAALERLAGQRADLDARAARATAERDEAGGEHATAAAIRAALPDGGAFVAEVQRLQRDAQNARDGVARARTAQAAEARALAADRERRAAADAEAKSWRARAGDAARRIADMGKRSAALAAEREGVAGTPALLDARIGGEAEAHEAARAAAATLAEAERAADAGTRAAEARARDAAEALAAARERRAGAAARAENHELRRVEMGRVSGERFECPAPVLPAKAGFDSTTVRAPADESATHDRLTRDRERLGPVNLVAEQELAELEGGAARIAAERAELGEAVAELRGSIALLNREGRQRLRAAFEAVDAHFRRLFTTLFDGGQAHLAMVDSDDPLEAGLEIMAQPPGKRLGSLTLLSGGEQALTATALIFALFLTNPAPICVLDEVDAPLDDANVERFCDLLDRMTRETATRYLIVTHNAVTMSRMHRLFGVTMIEKGVSRLVSVDLGGAGHLLAAE